MEKIFIWHVIFFAEGSCDNFKTGLVLLIAPDNSKIFYKKKKKKKKKKTYLKISWPEF